MALRTDSPALFPRASLLLPLLLALTACAGIHAGDDPILDIDLPILSLEPPPDRLTQVTIRNGRGEVVVDQTPDPNRRTTVQPPAGTFDGTLVIEWETREGRSGSQTLQHDPENSFKLDFDWRDGEFELTETPRPQPPANRFSFSASGGYLERSLGGTGAFTDISGGETALLEVDRMDGFRVGGRVDYRLFGPTRVGAPGLGFNADALDLSLSIDYTELRGDAARFVEPGTGDTGITFPLLVDGSEGLDFGATGAEARMKANFKGLSVRISDRKEWVEGEDGVGGYWRYSFEPGLLLDYGRYDTDARIQNATFADIVGTDRTELDDWRLGISLGSRVQYHTRRFAPFIGGRIELYHRWSDLDGVQQTNGGGFLTAAQEQPIPYSDSDSGLGARLTGELGVEGHLSDNLTIGIKGFLSYDTSTPYGDKRDNPADDANSVRTEGSLDYGVIGGVRVSF